MQARVLSSLRRKHNHLATKVYLTPLQLANLIAPLAGEQE
jgi:hypothetical protein